MELVKGYFLLVLASAAIYGTKSGTSSRALSKTGGSGTWGGDT